MKEEALRAERVFQSLVHQMGGSEDHVRKECVGPTRRWLAPSVTMWEQIATMVPSLAKVDELMVGLASQETGH